MKHETIRDKRVDLSNLRAVREEAGFRLRDVEKLTGVTKDVIGTAERGEHLPNAEDTVKLLVFYDLDPKTLLSD